MSARFAFGDIVVADGASLIEGDVLDVTHQVEVLWRPAYSWEQPDDLERVETPREPLCVRCPNCRASVEVTARTVDR